VILDEFRCSKVYLKSAHARNSGTLRNKNRDYASCRNSGIHLFSPFLPFTRKSPFLVFRRKVYVSRRDLLGIRLSESESVILGGIQVLLRCT